MTTGHGIEVAKGIAHFTEASFLVFAIHPFEFKACFEQYQPLISFKAFKGDSNVPAVEMTWNNVKLINLTEDLEMVGLL